MIIHPELRLVIMVLRPGIDRVNGFLIQESDDGPCLVDGSMDNPPTQKEVDSVTQIEIENMKIRMNGPLAVSSAQAKLALYQAGLLDQVKQAAEAYEPMKIFFDNSPTWSEIHPYVLGLAAMLGISDEQKTELFNKAYKL